MMPGRRIALVAHDAKKQEMVDWVRASMELLQGHDLWATGTTGQQLRDATGLPIRCLLRGPLGGDQQLGAMIAEGRIDILIFFIDPLSSLPHDVDVKALLRISTLYQTVLAINAATASLVMNSPLLETQGQIGIPVKPLPDRMPPDSGACG